MNNSHFLKNPLVTLCHNYDSPPVGKSLWQKRVRDGAVSGIKAKTQYPPKPNEWGTDAWPPDKVFALVQNQLLLGKSIGFLPTKVHVPDDKEYTDKKWPANTVTRVFDEWLLLEYAAVFMPANQDSLVEAVSKGLELSPDLRKALGLDDSLFKTPAAAKAPQPSRITPFTTLASIESAVNATLLAVDYETIIQRSIAAAFERARGRV